MRGISGAGLSALLCLGIVGCSVLKPVPPAPPATASRPLEAFHLEGRISVKTDSQTFSGGIDWSHQGMEDEILLSTPLGQGVAELRSSAGGVSLTDNEGRQYQAVDMESLLRERLGFQLPLRGLHHWLDARPRPESPHTLEVGPDGRVDALLQDGWRIDYGRYSQQGGRWLPGKLFGQHGESLEFRLVVDQWNLP